MAKHLNALLKCIMMAAVTVAALSASAAEEINDPTRPPAAAAAVINGVVVPEASQPVLQSVMISRKHKIAVISGQEVVLGGMVGDARLVAVRDQSVDLRNADGSLQTLQMYAGVTKTVIEVKRKTPAKVSGIKNHD